MEDLPTVEPPLTATKAKYIETINDLSRVALPSFVKQEYSIDNCKTSEMEALAAELGLVVFWDFGIALLTIQKPTYVLRIFGRAFHG